MAESNYIRLSGLILLSLVATACASDSNPDLSSPGADVSGSWSGDFTEQNRPPQDAVSGGIAMSFAQGGGGLVVGQARFTDVGCLSTLAFQGVVTDGFLVGSATKDDVAVRFEVDGTSADQGAYGTLEGTFHILSGPGCPSPFEGWFIATGDPPAR